MKIISKFQDYYDIGIAYGVDEKLYFKRVESVVDEYNKYDNHTAYLFYKDKHYWRVKFFYGHIGFCGQKYPFIRVTIEKIVKKDKETFYRPEDETYLYTFESFKHYLDRYVDRMEIGMV